MTQLETNAPPAPVAPSPPLFGEFAFSGDAFCEAFAGVASPREHWRELLRALERIGSDQLDERQARASHMRHEDGATYNPFDDAEGRGIPWALEVIPLPITAGEWNVIETGLIQRARLLEQILADTYGPQELIKQGHLPAELVFANPNFLHACHGAQPAGDRFLTYYAADLYRGTDGRFRVLRDFGANPAGLGYALENRIVISRIFPRLYHRTQIRRLAPFFHTFRQSLVQRAALNSADPDIVLLSPGPDSRIYFEHALLSRYLGYPLVEGQDLTVRNGRVYLKKLAGLEPVECILRHIHDRDSDPFALRRTAGGGTAGLIQASRDRHVHLVNPVGSGFIETPALGIYLSALCQKILGEPLQLDNHPAWWCGTPDSLNHVLANWQRLTIGPAMDPAASVFDTADLKAMLQSAPYRVMAQERLCASMVPAWSANGVCGRPTLFRIFACATADGFAVMPGGLAISAKDRDTLVTGKPERQQSKDIWVVSEEPVEPFSLLGSLQAVSVFRRDSDLPSRVADHLLWLGRYLERAEGLIRLLRSVFSRLAGEDRPAEIAELPFLLDLLRADKTIPPAGDGADPIPRYRQLTQELTDALYRDDRPESVAAVINQVRQSARNVRDRLSRDSWRVINRLDDFTDAHTGDPLERLNDTLFTLSAFSGLAMESMTRGLGWRFMDIGRRVERAMNQASLIRVGLPQVCRQSPSTLESLLEIFDSIMTYRARYRASFQPAPVLDLLIMDGSNPKSLAFQVDQLAAHTEHLPSSTNGQDGNAELQLARDMREAVSRIDLTNLDCFPDNSAGADLVGGLESILSKLTAFTQQISAHYLTRVPATPHFSIISSDRRP